MTQHLLGTPLPDDLAAEAERVVAFLRTDAARQAKIEAVDELVYALVRVGIEVHFHVPARLFSLNALLVKVIDVAAATTLRALKSAARRILKSLTDDQLREVADEIEDRLYQVEVVEAEG